MLEESEKVGCDDLAVDPNRVAMAALKAQSVLAANRATNRAIVARFARG